jgi:hypothetical protein
MRIKIKGSYSEAFGRLKQLRQLPAQGNIAAVKASERMQQEAVENLSLQGRARSPKLSSATLLLQSQLGAPTGNGVRKHIDTNTRFSGRMFVALCGIPEGKPSMVARVQNNGAVIKVTPKMRGFLAAHGIYLRQKTKAIRIPARRFWDMAWRDAKRQYKADLRRLLP